MRLYEIDQRIESLVDEETGEIVDFDEFERLSMARDVKIGHVALRIRNLKPDVAELKAEEEALKKRRTVAENKIKG